MFRHATLRLSIPFSNLFSFSSLFLFLLSFIYAHACFSVENIIDPDTKKSFPSEVSIIHNGEEHRLNLTGTRSRTKFFINIYAIAHYMENPPAADKKTKEAIYTEILSDQKAKQLSIEWMYDATVQQIREGFLETFKKELSTKEFLAVNKEIDQFLASYQKDVKANDQHVMRWLPDNTIEIYVNGDRKTCIANADFSKALWRLWFGEQSADNRSKLVSRI